MKPSIRALLLFLSLAVGLCLASCAMLNSSDFWAPAVALVRHQSAFVSVPATAGAVVGGLVGVPLTLVALPATLPTAIALSDGDMMMLLPLVPMLAVAELGAVLLGGPVWLICGWW